MFNPGPSAWGPPPIHVGALGPRLTEMVAAEADGLLVMPFTSRRFFEEHTLEAGRPWNRASTTWLWPRSSWSPN